MWICGKLFVLILCPCSLLMYIRHLKYARVFSCQKENFKDDDTNDDICTSLANDDIIHNKTLNRT